jgi:hypothetical protein
MEYFFNENTDVNVKAEVCESLNIVSESLNDKYLGLSALVGIDRSDCFRHLIDRVRGKTKGWKEKLLSIELKRSSLNPSLKPCRFML